MPMWKITNTIHVVAFSKKTVNAGMDNTSPRTRILILSGIYQKNFLPFLKILQSIC